MTNDLDKILEGKDKLTFEEASDLTIEEAVRKEADIQAGITKADGALDKYIKKNRDQVATQKFANKIEDVDTTTLDKFIQNQRLNMEGKLNGDGLAKGAALAGAGTAAATAGDKLVDGAGKLTQNAKSGLSQVGDKLTASAGDLSGEAKAGLDGLTGQAQAAGEQVTAKVDGLSGQAKAGLAAGGAGLAAGAAALGSAGDKLAGGAGKLTQNAKSGLSQAGDKLTAGAGELSGKTKAGLDGLTGQVQATGEQVTAKVDGLSGKAKAGLAAGGAGLAAGSAALGTAATSTVGKTKDILASDTLWNDPNLLTDKAPSKKKKWIIGSLAALLLGTLGLGYGLNQWNQSASNATASSGSSASKATTTSSSSQTESTDLKAFNDLYANFFVDKEATKPKNSEFDKLPDLEAALKKLEGTADYEAAKAKYDGLNKAVTAIKAINDKFETPAIVDGEKVEATLKADANFDDLSSDVLNTGKASMDSLIQAVLSEGRSLAAAGGGTLTAGVASSTGSATTAGANSGSSSAAEPAPATSEAASAADNTTAAAAAEPSPAAPVVEAAPAPATEATPAPAAPVVVAAPAAPIVEAAPAPAVIVADPANLPAGHIVAPTNYGYVSYDPSILQRDVSRVPFNFDLIADKANPAWTFNPGVMEEIIRVSQQRGYINGYEFILEPVNIVNGNGYYNMYKPDGSYLFTINAKTGYFVGNGAGYADALDY